MRRNYNTEIEELEATYRSTIAAGANAGVSAAVSYGGPVVFVGSGGALAAARLAADLHTSATGSLATALTPLEAASMQLGPEAGVVLFTASGRHPDASMVLAAARRRGAAHLGVVTTRSRDDLPATLASGDVQVGTVASPPDGFLATNSLLAMTAALCSAFGIKLARDLPALADGPPPAARGALLVLTGPGLAAVGVDLEARLVETGLASVQLADYRNAAHGRHVGLVRNMSTTTVVAVADSRSEALALRTLDLLPPEVDVTLLKSDLAWPSSALDLLVASMRLVAETGSVRGVDPGQPGVKPFGRRLYHLPTQRLLPSPQPDPIRRKSANAQGTTAASSSAALASWLSDVRAVTFRGIVLDYDGTCCPTWDRFEPPPGEVQDQLVRLLAGGLKLGFATGRGKSLHETTRAWLPTEYWSDVAVGLYNGSRLLRLNDEPPSPGPCEDDLAEAADRAEAMLSNAHVLIERRATQVSISHRHGTYSGTDLLPSIQALIERSPRLACKAFASGHSVDIMRSTAGKTAVLDDIRQISGGEVLAIGDQGQVGGNDFELLAATRWSLSVDRCSADLTRCWNLDNAGHSGPDLLVRYLRSVKPNRSGARFAWTH